MIGQFGLNSMMRSIPMSPVKNQSNRTNTTEGSLFDLLSKTDGTHTISGFLSCLVISTGEQIDLDYDKSSTDTNPVIHVSRKDTNGNVVFEGKIQINQIDLKNATPIEIYALQVYRQDQGESIPIKEEFAAIDAIERFGNDTKVNFFQVLQDYLGRLEKEKPSASKFDQLLIERYLFAHQSLMNIL